jgi:pantetheine-phosphate adenylyltransferase
MSHPSRLAIFPGSFDPLTNGHLDVIRRAAGLFDAVVVAVLVNADKRPFFTLAERTAMIREAIDGFESVTVEHFEGLLVDFAARRGASAVVRGVRGAADFDYEWQMAHMNRHLADGIETVLLVPSQKYMVISSHLVREIAAMGGPLDGLVPRAVAPAYDARRRAVTERQA